MVQDVKGGCWGKQDLQRGHGDLETLEGEGGLQNGLGRLRTRPIFIPDAQREAVPRLTRAKECLGEALGSGACFLTGQQSGLSSWLQQLYCPSLQPHGMEREIGDGSLFFLRRPSTRRLEKTRGVGARTKTEQGNGTGGSERGRGNPTRT